MTAETGGGGGADGSRARRVAVVLVLLLLALVAALWWGRDDEGGRSTAVETVSRAKEEVVTPTPDHAPRTRERVTTAQPEAPVEVASDEEATSDDVLSVLVRTESGTPVRGIGVVVSDGYGSWDDGESGEDGRLRLRRPQGDGKLLVALREEQQRLYLPVETRALGPEERDVEVVLVEGAPIRGRVVGPDGAPLVDVYLEAVERPSGRLLPPVLTDGEGRFAALVRRDAVADVHLDGVALVLFDRQKDGLEIAQSESAWHGRWTGLAPGPEEHALRADALERRELAVHVRTPDGRPVPLAVVRSRIGRWAEFGKRTVTDEEGLAVLRTFVGRPRTVVVSLHADPPEGGPWVAPEPRPLDGTEDEVTLVLRPAARITGRVVRADGEAITWCGIDALHGDDTIASATSGGDGAFEIALPDDAPAPLRLTARFYDQQLRRWEGTVDDVWPGATDVEIQVALPE